MKQVQQIGWVLLLVWGLGIGQAGWTQEAPLTLPTSSSTPEASPDSLASPMEANALDPLDQEPLLDEPLTAEESETSRQTRPQVQARQLQQQRDSLIQRALIQNRAPVQPRSSQGTANTATPTTSGGSSASVSAPSLLPAGLPPVGEAPGP